MRADLRILVVTLAAMFYLAAGTYKASHFSGDFIPVYTGARCLIHGCNPYVIPELERQYLEAHGFPKLMGPVFWFGRPPVYPPSTLLAAFPLAFVPFQFAAVTWALLGGSALIAATAMLLWVWGKNPSWVVTLVASIFLIRGDYLLGQANPATLACSLAMIGTMLFLTERHVPLGALLLTLSLAIKPQIAGVILVYLLVRGIGRRWAALSLAGGAAFLLGGILILQLHPASRHWLPTLRTNLAGSVLPGQINDPTPANPSIGLTNLQTVTSVFLASPEAWNAAALGITLLLFVLWMVSIRKLKVGLPDQLLALLPLLALSLFPIYHRSCDAIILLLSLPIVEMVLRRRKLLGACLAIVTAVLLSGALVSPVLAIVGRFWNLDEALSHKGAFILLERPWPLELLMLFVLYLAVLRCYQADQLSHQTLIPTSQTSVEVI